MELIKAILLGIIQGLTEFLPVSSSGHLVIGSELLNFQEQGLAFDVFLHLGTLAAVVIAFRKDIWEMILAPIRYYRGEHDGDVRKYFLWDVYVVLATIPAVIVGLFFKDSIESLFGSSLIAYCMLIVTGLLMLCTKLLPAGEQPVNWWRSIVVGCAQACAILPGLSRSGSTIFAGMAMGIPREEIARFSFIMSIPAILGAAVLQAGDLITNPPPQTMYVALIAGVVSSMIAGYLAIKLLFDVIRKNRLPWFGYYCLALATVGLVHHFFIAG